MNRYILFAVALIGLLILSPQQSFAAYSASDGEVKGTLEITPKDPPYAGLPLNLKFQFSDTPQGFTLRNCNCQLSVEEPGRLPSNIPLTLQNESGPDVNFVSVPYLFPSNANYKLVMNAQPKETNAFVPFTLSWDVTVQENKHLVPYTSHEDKNDFRYLGIAIPVGIAVLFILFLAFRYFRKHRIKNK